MSSASPLSRAGLLGLLSAALVLGCNSKSGVDAGTPEQDAGAQDAGVVDAGFKCRIDDDCAVLATAVPPAPGLRCDNDPNMQGSRADGGVPSYDCIPATPCNGVGECTDNPPPEVDYFTWYCTMGNGCRCVTEAVPDAGTSGICRRVKSPCEPCTSDAECWNGVSNEAVCKTLQGDSSGAKYCFKKQSGPSCGCGLVNDGMGACVPQSGSCDQVGCTKDADCPGGAVCNVAACLCEQRCRWNFDPAKLETEPSCGPSKSCWVDADALDPESAYFGSGRCRPPCANDTDCSYGGKFADGRQKLRCAAEHGKSGDSLKRCRPNGDCMDTRECPGTDAGTLSKGYCDRASFICKEDCRIGTDPVTGTNFDDCTPGNKCVDRSGVHVCERRSCVEMGGAHIACQTSQLCNNEDRDGDGAPNPAPANVSTDDIGCYDIPKPPYCFACEKNEDCQTPAFASLSPLPNLCVVAGPNAAGDPQKMCGLATYNDLSVDDAGVTRESRMCPTGWYATPVPVDLVDGDNRCNSNADCSLGNAGGICEFDTSLKISDDQGKIRTCSVDGDCSATGEFKCNNLTGGQDAGTCIGKSCMCNAPNGPECPNSPDAGIQSFCRYKVSGHSLCVASVVCLPGQKFVATPVAQHGCGL